MCCSRTFPIEPCCDTDTKLVGNVAVEYIEEKYCKYLAGLFKCFFFSFQQQRTKKKTLFCGHKFSVLDRDFNLETKFA